MKKKLSDFAQQHLQAIKHRNGLNLAKIIVYSVRAKKKNIYLYRSVAKSIFKRIFAQKKLYKIKRFF